MRYGKFLPEKGTIGFVAPSFGCNIEPYRSAFINAQKIWEQQGYGFSFGPNAYEGCGIGISNTPQKCAEEFHTLTLQTQIGRASCRERVSVRV